MSQSGGGDPTAADPRPDLLLRGETKLVAVVDALDHIAGVLPPGHELFTAIVDGGRRASDVLVRDARGRTSVRLGLSDAEHARLAALIDALRDTVERASTAEDRSAPLPRSSPVPPRGGPGGTGSRAPSPLQDFRALVEDCPVPLLVISAGGIIRYASPASASALGVEDCAHLEGRRLGGFLHPDDRDRVTRVMDLSRDTSQSTTMSVRLLDGEGGVHRSEMAVRALTGHTSLILALEAPRPARSGIEEILATERRQRALAGAADVGLALVGTAGAGHGALIDMNPAFGRLLDGSPGELVGIQISDLVDGGDASRLRLAIDQLVAGAGPQSLEARLADTRRRHVRLHLNLDRSLGGATGPATLMVRDITEERDRVSELHRTVARLERENRQLAEFARITAHDLMAPLRALSGMVDLLAPTVDPAAEDTLATIQGSLARMTAMVDSAVGFAGAHTGRSLHGPVDLNQVVEHALATLNADIVGSDAQVTVHALPTVVGDPAQLERLFLSLLTNALSYSGGAAPEIEIRARADGTMWRLLVADQGIGVAPEARESIFGLFARHGDAPARAGAGRGIGLATCRQIVDGLGGRIWVEDNRPRGSIFAFTLPAG